MQNKCLSWDVMEAGQVLSLPVGCQLSGLALSARDKLRVTTLDFAGAPGLCILSGHATWHSALPGEEEEEELRAFRVWVCVCFVEVEGCDTRKLSLWYNVTIPRV